MYHKIYLIIYINIFIYACVCVSERERQKYNILQEARLIQKTLIQKCSVCSYGDHWKVKVYKHPNRFQMRPRSVAIEGGCSWLNYHKTQCRTAETILCRRDLSTDILNQFLTISHIFSHQLTRMCSFCDVKQQFTEHPGPNFACDHLHNSA